MEFMVDVNIAVYNHEPYLRKTLDSVLRQITTFPFKVLIADDCSTDGSIDILKEYEKKYQDRVQVIYQPKNIGITSPDRNGIILLRRSTAKYIALLDGDDYWCDDYKLEKQVDFLENNPDYSLCFHDVYIKEPGRRRKNQHLYFVPETTDLYYLLMNKTYISTLSAVFKNQPGLPDFLSKFTNAPLGDYLLYVYIAQFGKIKYFPDKMGVYRAHRQGSWSQLGSAAHEKAFFLLKDLYQILSEKDKPYLRVHIYKVLENIIRSGILANENINWEKYYSDELKIDFSLIQFISDSIRGNLDPSQLSTKVHVKTLLKAFIIKAKRKLYL